jgi:hypothetical protein
MTARLLIAVCLVAGTTLGAANPVTPQLADAFEKKIVVVQANASAKAPKPTQFTEAETNSFLKFKAGPLLPTGMTEPVITMHGAGRVTGRRSLISTSSGRSRAAAAGSIRPVT